MDGYGDKKLHVGRFDYTIDEGSGIDIVTIVTQIHAALANQSVVKVPVLDDERNRLTLYLNGGQIDALAIDLDEGPRPGAISP